MFMQYFNNTDQSVHLYVLISVCLVNCIYSIVSLFETRLSVFMIFRLQEHCYDQFLFL